MAAKTPVSVGTTGHVDPTRGMYKGPLTTGQSYLVEGSKEENRLQYIIEVYYFSDIDDGDTWASGINGIKACLWQGDALADACQASATSAGVVTFETVTTADINGWLWLLIDPITSGRSGTRCL